MKISPYSPQTMQNRTQKTQAQPNFKGLITAKVEGALAWKVGEAFRYAKTLKDMGRDAFAIAKRNNIDEAGVDGQYSTHAFQAAQKTLKGMEEDAFAFAEKETAKGVDIEGQYALFIDTNKGETHSVEKWLLEQLEELGVTKTEKGLTPNSYNHLSFGDVLDKRNRQKILTDPHAKSIAKKVIDSVSIGKYTCNDEQMFLRP